MKAFLVLPFLFLLFGSSQESALSRKRSIRGLNTTLQTNFNGTFHIKNPCTNADLETSSYVASHEFHQHVKENNWNDYLQKCSAVIYSFLQGIGNLVRVNSKQNAAFNFHVNTSISQKQDVGDCAKQCNSLPTIVLEAESCELPPPCKSSPKVHNECLLKQDVRQNSDKIPENYLTTPQCSTEDTITEGFVNKLMNYGSNENITPISGFSTSTAPAGIEETNDFSQNQQTTCSPGRDFTASITIKPEDEFTTPAPWEDYPEGSLFTNPGTQDYPYLTPTISEYETTPQPSFSDEKIINNQYQVDQKPIFGDLGEEILDQAPIRTSPSDFESESIRVEKPFKYQKTIPVGLREPDYVEEMIPPSERLQPADLKTKPNPQILDKFPLRQQTQSIDDRYINTTPYIDQQKEEMPPQGGYPIQPETSYPPQTNEYEYPTTPSVDYLASPPSDQILPPLIPENDFQPESSLSNEFSESKSQSITDVYTPSTEQPFIPREKFPTELPVNTPNYPEQPLSYPDDYTMGPEKTINDFYTPVLPKFRKNEKAPLSLDKIDNIYTTMPPPERVTVYNSDRDILNDKPSSSTLDEEFYIKSQSSPPSAPFPKGQPFLNEKTTPGYVSSDDYENSDLKPFKPTYPEVEEPRFSNFENPDQPPRTFEPITTPPPPVNYPKDDFYPLNDRPTSGNSPVFSGPQTPLEAFEPNTYVEASSQASAEVVESRFPNSENPHQQPRQSFEPITTPLPPVTYPEGDFYTTPVLNEPETPPEVSEPIAYAEASSQASAEVKKIGFPNFEKPSQLPRRTFVPTTTPPPPVTYPENDFYPSDYPSTLENPPPSTFEPTAYSEASSQASAKVEELGFNDFEKPDQPPRRTFEPITTSPPPVTYPEDDFYPTSVLNEPQTPPEISEPTAYAEASSQASAEVQKIGLPNFENRDQQPKPNFEPITILPPPVTYPEGDFYPTPELNEPQTPLEALEPNTYAKASSQASAEVVESRFPNFENPSQPPRQIFEPITASPRPVTYPEGDFYPTPVLKEPETPPEVSEPIGYAEASSQASAEVKKIGFPNFENPSQPPRQSFEPTTTPLPPVTYSENDFYPSDYPPKRAFDQSSTTNSKDYPTDSLPTTQSPDNLSFSPLKAQSESIIPNDYNRPAPTDLPPEADLPLWTKRPIEPQPLPVNVEDVAVASSDSQSDLQPLNQFTSPQPQPPLDYYDEIVPDRYSQKPLVPLDTTSIPQPQPEEIPPSYEDYTPGEEPFTGDSTPSTVKSEEKMLIYSTPFEPEPQQQPQPQPSSYIPGDNILASKTFENSKTPNLLSSNLESRDRSSFSTTVGYTQPSDFVTTPTPFTDIPSFQTPPRSKPEEIITDSQQNIGAQETLLFANNVSPQPKPTTEVKTYKEIVTTEYQTSPAPSPQPQTTMNYANQHSDDNLNGKIPGLFTHQQQLVTPEPDFDSSDVASESFSQSKQITENHPDYPIEKAPKPPLNYPNPNSFLPYNNQLRSQPIYRQPPPRQQDFLMNSSQYPYGNVKQNMPPVRGGNFEPPLMASRIPAPSRMQPGNNVWMPRSNEQVPIYPNDNFRPPAPYYSQVPPERFFYPGQNYNPRGRYFPQGYPRGYSRPAPNFPPSYEPRRPFNPDFQNPQRELITDYNRPPSFDSSNSVTKTTKVVEEIITTDLPTAVTESAVTESPTEKQLAYPEKFLNDKRIPEPVRDDRRFEPSENYRPLNREYGPRNFPQYPQQVEPFYGGFPPNVSYPDYGPIRPDNDYPVPGHDYPQYPQYDQMFPNPPPRPQFVHDPQSMSNRQFDRRVPDLTENQYYQERPQRPVNYLPNREPLFEKQQPSNPAFQTLEHQIPLQEPPSPEMPNESERNYFRDNSPGWERPNPPSPLPESQLVPHLTDPSNNPDRAASGRFNYMDRPLQKPFYEDRMRPVSTPERF